MRHEDEERNNLPEYVCVVSDASPFEMSMKPPRSTFQCAASKKRRTRLVPDSTQRREPREENDEQGGDECDGRGMGFKLIKCTSTTRALPT
jgi:hypothetical protein